MTPALRVGSVIACVLLLMGCAGQGSKMAAPEPAKPIEIARFYTGRWYEIARTPMRLTDGCVAGTTDYFNRPNGQLIDRDACRMGTPEGEEKTYQGPVTILDPGINAKVSVRYTVWGVFPVWRTYWMLDHGADYAWFIVSDPAFENVSLFTRDPRPSEASVEMLVRRAQELGYDTGKLEFPAEFPPGQG